MGRGMLQMIRSGLRRFFHNRSGNFAVITAIVSVPLVLGVGLATDYTRLTNERSFLQNVADSAALAGAASRETSFVKIKAIVEQQYQANYGANGLGSGAIQDVIVDDTSVKVTLKSIVPMTFMRVAGIESSPVAATAVAVRNMGNLELGLVLDNTWSMSEIDKSGVSKIASLKAAALSLVDEVTRDKSADVKIAVVPYADYVNVGTKYRNEPWLDIPQDYTVEPAEKTCKTLTTKSVCVQKAATYSCTKVVDGVAEKATCGGGCTKTEVQKVPPYQSCTGGGSPKAYKWYGCIGSRMDSNSRLHDQNPAKPYPGYVETSQKCLTPIVTLTSNKASVVAAINGMILNIGNYKPATYIPAGVVWGLNVLSPGAPFTEAATYDPKNRDPRKVMVLMTDGENTLRFNNGNGRHVAPSSNASQAKGELKKTDSDTAEICAYMKQKNIEIFSVAFMVDNADAKALLESCATDSDHYFDASDGDKLKAAFETIGRSLTKIRLTQ